MATKKELAILLLDRNAFYYFSEFLPSPIQSPFSQEIVRDLEILNKEQFITTIRNFIEANNLPPANIVILLSDNVLFEKNILNPVSNPLEDDSNKSTITANLEAFREKSTKEFIDTVPFENIITHAYDLENGVKIVATNNELYMTIKEAFEQKESTIFSVIPAALLGETILNGLNTETIKTVSSQLETIKQQSLIKVYQNTTDTMSDNSKSAVVIKKGVKNQRLYVFVGVFIFLFAVMGFLLYQQNQEASNYAKSPTINNLPPFKHTAASILTPTLSQVNTIVNPASTSTNDMSTMKIQITATNITSSQATNLKFKLQQLGFSNVNIINQNGSPGSSALVIFSHSVPETFRNKILDVLKNANIIYSVQETTQSQFDAVIILSSFQ